MIKFDTNYNILPALTKIPAWLQVYNKDICWKVADTERSVYLTFDDGPHPIVTPLVLNLLAEFRIKASFFCIGKNVQEHPEIFKRILMEGHTIGNHSFSHKSGWKMTVDDYVKDVNQGAVYIESKLFRPPYGRITPLQFKQLKGSYRIVMWDVLSKDYDMNVKDDDVIKNVVDNVSEGSIIVMHDNNKTEMRMELLLRSIIPSLKNSGWNFKIL